MATGPEDTAEALRVSPRWRCFLAACPVVAMVLAGPGVYGLLYLDPERRAVYVFAAVWWILVAAISLVYLVSVFKYRLIVTTSSVTQRGWVLRKAIATGEINSIEVRSQHVLIKAGGARMKIATAWLGRGGLRRCAEAIEAVAPADAIVYRATFSGQVELGTAGDRVLAAYWTEKDRRS